MQVVGLRFTFNVLLPPHNQRYGGGRHTGLCRPSSAVRHKMLDYLLETYLNAESAIVGVHSAMLKMNRRKKHIRVSNSSNIHCNNSSDASELEDHLLQPAPVATINLSWRY